MRLNRSPVLRDQLRWGPCSGDDGLNWTLIYGDTSIDLHPQGMLKPCPSINLTQQMAETEASLKMPGSAANSKPGIAKGFLLQPSHGVRTRQTAALQTKSSAKDLKQQAAAATPVPLPSQRDVLWCWFTAAHGHVVFASPPATSQAQVRLSRMFAEKLCTWTSTFQPNAAYDRLQSAVVANIRIQASPCVIRCFIVCVSLS